MASSSGTSSVSIIPPKEKYDVFISFRGTDTRQTFTSHLHAALIRRKVKTYIDYELERGDEVGPALLKAIKESKISVVIFSKNYADSTWCLDELAYILKCKEKHGRHVIPVFYDVEPSHVRHQRESYGTAFAEHERRLKDKSHKVAKWKEALEKAANLSGFDSTSKAVRHDSDLVDQVVAEVLAKLNRESSTDLTGLIGAEGRIQKILLELDMVPEDVRVCFLVLWGMGGVGKTTLANAVYHGLSSNFESHCFLANVRERSGTAGASSPELYALRDKLLRKLLVDSSLTIDTPTIDAYQKERLRRTKVLVVLDDVNDSSQLTFLAEEVPFGPGSRIIITTREMQPVQETLVLNEVADRDVKIYEVEKLNEVESLQLIYSNQSDSATRWTGNSESLQRRVLDYADGIPLALNILRSLFLQWKGEPEQFWDKLKMFPSEKLQKVYRASYDGLGESEKEIFLDIACFHKTEELCDAKRIMAACGLFPDGIEILIDMSLISIRDDRIWMHDVIQEMGREIVRQECAQDPGKRSRLYTFKDVCHVLENNKGTAAVKSISLKMAHNDRNVMLTRKAFTEMDNLRFLDFSSSFYAKVNVNTDFECLPNALKFLSWPGYPLKRLPDALKYLSWPGYPLKSLPSNFSPENLVELHMPDSRLQGLWNQGQRLPTNLRRIDLRDSSELTEVPDLSNCVCIESINLAGCDALRHIPSYFCNLTKLTDLNLRGCSKVRKLPELPRKMKFLDLNGTALEEVHSSMWSMKKIVELNLHSYKGNIPNVTWNLTSVTSLVLTGTRVESLPSSIENLSEVVSVELRACKSLVSLSTTICKLKSLERLDLCGCTRLKMFPEIEEPMKRLEYLSLQETGIEQLPPSIGNLVGLKYLNISNCKCLQSLPQLPCVPTLVANDCPTLKTVSYPMAAPTQYLNQRHSFCGSINLDETTRSNMMDAARLRIARMAKDHLYPGIVTLICPGIEIPNWFSCEKEGSFIKTKLPQHWFDENFLGFALSAVLPFYTARSVRLQCVCNLITDNKLLHQHALYHYHSHKARLDERSDHLLVVYRSISLPDIAKFSTEVSFEFSAKLDGQIIEVKKCGVCFLYAQGQDHDSLKFEGNVTEHATSGIGLYSEPESSKTSS